MLLEENDKYYYDQTIPDEIIRRFETYVYNPETGSTVTVLDWEVDVIRKAYGWRCRSDGSCRFTTVYIAIGKGNGKSGLLQMIGIHHLLPAWCGSRRNQVVCVAANYKQVKETIFKPARDLIEASPRLASVLDPKHDLIRVKGDPSQWLVLTGKPEGKAGFRPSCVLVDELHEFPNRLLLDAMETAMGKRMEPKPMLWIATNAGPTRSGPAWEYHSKALRILNGSGEDDRFLPVVYAAPDDCKIDDRKWWAAANPSLGVLCRADHLETECKQALGNPALEARFRRYYLTQFVKDASQGIDCKHWEAALVDELPKGYDKLPCIIHCDLSRRDDLTALAMLWYDKDKDYVYARVKHFVPGDKAREYIKRGVNYDDWAGLRHVSILEKDTLDDKAKLRLAQHIEKLCKRYDVQAFCYDRTYATELVGYLERNEVVPCIPVNQNSVSISPAVYDLFARLKHKRVLIKRNDCLTWQAGHCDFQSDRHLNLYPIKPGADKYDGGRRHLKIDGIQALLSALSEWLRRNVGRLDDKAREQEMIRKHSGEVKWLSM